MSLTKSDLLQIGKVIENKLEPVRKDISEVKSDLKDVKKRVRKTEKTVDVIARLYDAQDVKLAKRVVRIEQHLDLPPEN